MAYQEKQVGSQAMLIFALALPLVYLVLAVQYKSWTSLAAVILSVPLALLGTVLALVARSMDNKYLHASGNRAAQCPGESKRHSNRRVCAGEPQ